ncbi:hypothetical protein P7C73_g2772, partial [Tremellales sp. Uapishka_1]
MLSKIFLLSVVAAMALAAPMPQSGGGSAYTGTGGQASGGGVTKSQSGLINLDVLNIASDNAGNGGQANSGNALGGLGGCGGSGDSSGGSAYTGTGGTANGGAVTISQTGGLLNIDALNIASDNAGNGGSANSGSAVGGDGACGLL